jgi:hypothetical protein
MVESDLFEGTGAVDSWYGDRSQSTLWQESERGGGSTSSNHAPLEIVARALAQLNPPLPRAKPDTDVVRLGGSCTSEIVRRN